MNAEQFIVNVQSHCEGKLKEVEKLQSKWMAEHGSNLPKWHNEKLAKEISEVDAFRTLIEIIRTLQKEIEFHDFDKAVQRTKEKNWYKVLDSKKDFRDTILLSIKTDFQSVVEWLNKNSAYRMKIFKSSTLELKASIESIKKELATYDEIRQNHKKTLFD